MPGSLLSRRLMFLKWLSPVYSNMWVRVGAQLQRQSCVECWPTILPSPEERNESMLRFDRRLISHLDWTLLLLTLTLLSIGVMAVYSATYENGHRLSPWATRQISRAIRGLMGMFAALAIH